MRHGLNLSEDHAVHPAMARAFDFSAMADECERVAQEMVDEQSTKSMLELAQKWRDLTHEERRTAMHAWRQRSISAMSDRTVH